VALASTQPLTEMSTRNLSGGKGRPARKTENLAAVSRLKNVEALTPHNPTGLNGVLQE
jgi:hypothetical protein